MITRDDGFWAAGLVDGEGCFFLSVFRKGKYPLIYFAFEIGFREDDGPVLKELQRVLGGFGCIRTHLRVKGGNYRSIQLHVTKRNDLLEVANLFERYPLRSKKKVDFEIWSSALRYYAKKRGEGESAENLFEEMKKRAQQLRDNRLFKTQEQF